MSTITIRSLGSAFLEGCKTIGNSAEPKEIGKKLNALNDVETTNAVLRILTTSTAFIAPTFSKMVDGAHSLMDGLVVFGGAQNLKSKIQKTEHSHRPMKKIGLTLLTATDGFGFVSFLDGVGLVNLSKTAAKIGAFLRLPKFVTNIPLGAVIFGMASLGFALLFVDKLKHDLSASNPTRGDEHVKSRRMKLAAYATGTIAMTILCVGNATNVGALQIIGKVVCFANDIFKVGRSMYKEQHMSNIKNKVFINS